MPSSVLPSLSFFCAFCFCSWVAFPPLRPCWTHHVGGQRERVLVVVVGGKRAGQMQQWEVCRRNFVYWLPPTSTSHFPRTLFELLPTNCAPKGQRPHFFFPTCPFVSLTFVLPGTFHVPTVALLVTLPSDCTPNAPFLLHYVSTRQLHGRASSLLKPRPILSQPLLTDFPLLSASPLHLYHPLNRPPDRQLLPPRAVFFHTLQTGKDGATPPNTDWRFTCQDTGPHSRNRRSQQHSYSCGLRHA